MGALYKASHAEREPPDEQPPSSDELSESITSQQERKQLEEPLEPLENPVLHSPEPPSIPETGARLLGNLERVMESGLVTDEDQTEQIRKQHERQRQSQPPIRFSIYKVDDEKTGETVRRTYIEDESEKFRWDDIEVCNIDITTDKVSSFCPVFGITFDLHEEGYPYRAHFDLSGYRKGRVIKTTIGNVNEPGELWYTPKQLFLPIYNDFECGNQMFLQSTNVWDTKWYSSTDLDGNGSLNYDFTTIRVGNMSYGVSYGDKQFFDGYEIQFRFPDEEQEQDFRKTIDEFQTRLRTDSESSDSVSSVPVREETRQTGFKTIVPKSLFRLVKLFWDIDVTYHDDDIVTDAAE
jgi:hypothetical protein